MAVDVAMAAPTRRVHVALKKGESDKEKGMEIVHNSKMGFQCVGINLFADDYYRPL